jgi:hypothetical protein
MERSRRRRSADEPTAAALAAIMREWPAIAAELAVVDAEIAIALSDGATSVIDARRLQNAQAAADAASRPQPARRPRRTRRTA